MFALSPPAPKFLITIDTELDNGWSKPRTITTKNAEYLPRFQAFCERFGFPVTYLVNYEMAQTHAFVELGKDVLRRQTGEIGMHLHAWNSPPIEPLTDDDLGCLPYLIEYPEDLMRRKIDYMTKLLEDVFGQAPRSHRSGRWALDERYARILMEQNYHVDCSVTPHVNWRPHKGNPKGAGGSDYRDFPSQPYLIDPDDIHLPGCSQLLEIPTTVEVFSVPSPIKWLNRSRWAPSLARRALGMYFPERLAFIPGQRNAARLLKLAKSRLKNNYDYVELSFHSSELMPGGSPSFPTNESIERLYATMEEVFIKLTTWGFLGSTLSAYYDSWIEAFSANAPSASTRSTNPLSNASSPAVNS